MHTVPYRHVWNDVTLPLEQPHRHQVQRPVWYVSRHIYECNAIVLFHLNECHFTGDKQQRSTHFRMRNQIGNKHNTLTLHPIRKLCFKQLLLICTKTALILYVIPTGHLRHHRVICTNNSRLPLYIYSKHNSKFMTHVAWLYQSQKDRTRDIMQMCSTFIILQSELSVYSVHCHYPEAAAEKTWMARKATTGFSRCVYCATPIKVPLAS